MQNISRKHESFDFWTFSPPHRSLQRYLYSNLSASFSLWWWNIVPYLCRHLTVYLHSFEELSRRVQSLWLVGPLWVANECGSSSALNWMMWQQQGERTWWLRSKQIKAFWVFNQEGSGMENENSRVISPEHWLTLQYSLSGVHHQETPYFFLNVIA